MSKKTIALKSNTLMFHLLLPLDEQATWQEKAIMAIVLP